LPALPAGCLRRKRLSFFTVKIEGDPLNTQHAREVAQSAIAWRTAPHTIRLLTHAHPSKNHPHIFCWPLTLSKSLLREFVSTLARNMYHEVRSLPRVQRLRSIHGGHDQPYCSHPVANLKLRNCSLHTPYVFQSASSLTCLQMCLGSHRCRVAPHMLYLPASIANDA
jgi:hypothetical protein